MAKLLDTEINGNLNLNGENVNTFIAETKNVFTNFVNTKTGIDAVKIDDISPIKHEMNVNIRSKNLLDSSVLLEASGWVYENGYYCGAPSSLFSKYSKSSGNSLFGGFLPNTQYTLSFKGYAEESNPNGTLGLVFYYSDGTTTSLKIKEATEQPLSLTSTAGKTVVGLHATYNFNYKTYLKDIQLEVGTTATPYTPYVDINGAEIKKCGKNLIPTEFINNSSFDGDLEITDNGDGSFSIKGLVNENSYSVLTKTITLPAGTYCFSGLPEDWTLAKGYLLFAGKSISSNSTVITLTEEKTASLSIVVIKGVTYDDVIKPQIEVGTSVTEFEPYKEPITYTAEKNGNVEGVISLYPTTTLISNNCTIQAQYNRDLNKAFEELTTAILSLGGNV